jgi:hypothetical protein
MGSVGQTSSRQKISCKCSFKHNKVHAYSAIYVKVVLDTICWCIESVAGIKGTLPREFLSPVLS